MVTIQHIRRVHRYAQLQTGIEVTLLVKGRGWCDLKAINDDGTMTIEARGNLPTTLFDKETITGVTPEQILEVDCDF